MVEALLSADYTRMVQQLRASSYQFATFDQVAAGRAMQSPFALMRHDIDMELEAAVAMAELDRSLGVVATFFVLLRTDHYNLFSKASSLCVRNILACGHRLGLHFDPVAYEAADAAAINAACQHEAQILRDWFKVGIDVVSFHRPAPSILVGDPALTAPLVHTYQACFTQDVAYFSDSRGAWHHGHPLASTAFHARRPLHILTHPIWWQQTAQTPEQTLQRFVARHQHRFEVSLARNCTVYPMPDDSHD